MPGGYKNMKPEDGNVFSSKNQPSPESKSRGKRKALAIKAIASQLLEGGVKEAMKELAIYMGVDLEEIDVETAMHLKQMEKALKNGDTSAYNSVMDRIKGKPIQAIEVTENKSKMIKGITFKDAPEAHIS